MMSMTWFIGISVFLFLFLLIMGKRGFRAFSKTLMKLAIGVVFLFIFNLLAGEFGLHIPINFFTVFISGFLGVAGVVSLAAIQFFLFP